MTDTRSAVCKLASPTTDAGAGKASTLATASAAQARLKITTQVTIAKDRLTTRRDSHPITGSDGRHRCGSTRR
ncbi:hypothetical protein Lesp02_12340 [Lentzea sp. NBRC 105346]|nr:hypothetical protein Lesp02_12340 [Lentzea sp. NBRC 105346]